MASFDVGLQGYSEEKQKLFYHELTSRLKPLPGARSASLASTVPFDYTSEVTMVAPEEKVGGKENFISVNVNHIDCDYLAVMGTELLRGRNFTEQDTQSKPNAAIVNAFMAERLWPGQDPLGKRFRWGSSGSLWQVVGVARNSKCFSIGEEPRPVFYVPLAQSLATPITLHVWTKGDPAAMVAAVRDLMMQMDPRLPLYNVRTMSQHVHDSVLATMPLRMGAMLATTLGLLGAMLAVMGLYGVVSYVVSQRTREIGIRMALGAQTRDILRLVIRDGLKLTLIGLAIGMLCSLGLNGVFRRILYGLTPEATPVFVAVVALLASMALVACWLPAWRAANVDPMEALRVE
jgi:predicted permease